MKHSVFTILFSVLATLFSVAQSAKDYTQRGRDLLEKQEYVEALVNLNKAIEIDPNYASAYYRGRFSSFVPLLGFIR